MPKVLLFAACEKVIIDQETNVISLLSLVQDINVQTPPGVTSPPPNAIVPMQWSIVTIFLAEATDGGKKFEQRAVLFSPADAPVMQSAVALFEMTKQQHRIVSQVVGMPVGSSGTLFLRCFLREQGTNNWDHVGVDYPINIMYRPAITN